MLRAKGALLSIGIALVSVATLAHSQSLSDLLHKALHSGSQTRQTSDQQLTPEQQRKEDKKIRERNTPPPSKETQARIQLWSAEHEYFSSMPWPSTELAFKSLRVADEFNLDGPNVFAYGLDVQERYYRGEPIKCNLSKDWGWFICEVRLHRDKSDPSDLGALGTAFGERVRVSFTVVPREAITWNALVTQSFGVGRIMSIRIYTLDPSPMSGFTEAAKQYFTEKLGAAPRVTTAGGEGGQVMSNDCASALQRINNKPVAQLSQADLDKKEACNSEAMLGYVVQSDRANKVTTTEWSNHADHYAVLIESKSGVEINGVTDPSSFGVKITLQRSFEDTEKRLTEIMKTWTQQQAGNTQSKARGDF